VIIGFGLAVRSVGLATPLTGERECHSAMIARNLAVDGWRGLLYPRVDFPGDQPGYVAQEFPIAYALEAIAVRVLPLSGDVPLRIPALLFYAAATACLWDLLARRLGHLGAVFGTVVFTLYPVHLTMSVSPQPDEAAMALSLGALALMDRYLVHPRPMLAGSAAALAAAAFLAKPTFLFAIVALACLYASHFGFSSLLRIRVIAWGLAVMAPLGLWLVHAHILNSGSQFWPDTTVDDLNRAYLSQQGRLVYFVARDWYSRLALLFAAGHTLVGSIVAVLGLTFAVVGTQRRLVLAWSAAIIAYAAAVPHEMYTRGYDFLAVRPLAAFLAGVAASECASRLRSKIITDLVLSGTGMVMIISSWNSSMASLRNTNTDKIALGRAVRSVVPEGSLVVVSKGIINVWDASLLYQMQRRGWKLSARSIDEADPADFREVEAMRRRRGVLAFEALVPKAASDEHKLTVPRLEEYRSKGAAYLVIADSPSEWLEEASVVARHVLTHYVVTESSGHWLVVDVRRSLAERLGEFANSKDGKVQVGFEPAGEFVGPEHPPPSYHVVAAWRVAPSVATGTQPADSNTNEHPPFHGQIPASLLRSGDVLFEWK
jgi:dolichyl-phosphate-mannose-protein mannosyltransferase